ncbi:MAG: GntR family transcriptional regulator [Sphingomonadales bacterium]|jgi:DNA-binding GntR family transcriptional regulator|nr:GntR family transcriptional regulator [Sphingomonadales bacterium]MBK9003829.1 GntR family transcriptional regulator [Sphingomonadales bacterium]MBK9269003.1 GntR family transcriptional regulator [Sphingomonadales bacterium]MBP6434418.1 GntR family transcriptional regulator [Sphingorhabdus sp.]
MPTTFTSIGATASRAKPTAAEIARSIVEGLEAGEFTPGQRMVEADLCLRFGVGRQIIREALQHLNAYGVVALEPNRGAHIIHVTREEAVMTLELTELLFGLVSRSAARRIAAGGNGSRLSDAIGELLASAQTDDPADYMRARRHLFAALSHIASNPELNRIMEQVRVHVMRAQFGFAAFKSGHAHELAEIGRTVLAGNSEAAEELSRAYVRRIRELLQQI